MSCTRVWDNVVELDSSTSGAIAPVGIDVSQTVVYLIVRATVRSCRASSIFFIFSRPHIVVGQVELCCNNNNTTKPRREEKNGIIYLFKGTNTTAAQ